MTTALEDKDRLGHGSNKRGAKASNKSPTSSSVGKSVTDHLGSLGFQKSGYENQAGAHTYWLKSDKPNTLEQVHSHMKNLDPSSTYTKAPMSTMTDTVSGKIGNHPYTIEKQGGNSIHLRIHKTQADRQGLESLEAKGPHWLTDAVEQFSQRGQSRIDEAKGIAYDVKVLGKKSKSWHKREYPEKVVQESLPLYEGVTVNIDHPSKETAEQSRSFNHGFGILRGCYVHEGEIYAKEFHFDVKHPSAPHFIWRAKNAPNSVGFSHNAKVLESLEGNRRIVQQIQRVRSVDLVSGPATTNGIFESEEPMSVGMDNSLGGMPTDVQEDDPICAMLLDKVREICCGEGDPAAKAKAIGAAAKTLLKASDELEKANPSNSGAPDTSADDDTTPVSGEGGNGGDMGKAEEALQENTTLKTRLQKMERREAARKLFDAAEIKPSDEQVEAVSVLETTEAQQKLVATWKPTSVAKGATAPTAGVRPKSVPASALESTTLDKSGADQTKSFDPSVTANKLRSRP